MPAAMLVWMAVLAQLNPMTWAFDSGNKRGQTLFIALAKAERLDH